MEKLYPNIIDSRSLNMKNIYKLLMGTLFIAMFGFRQPSFTEHVISTSAEEAISVY
jgi:hypothetical protein